MSHFAVELLNPYENLADQLFIGRQLHVQGRRVFQVYLLQEKLLEGVEQRGGWFHYAGKRVFGLLELLDYIHIIIIFYMSHSLPKVYKSVP